MKVIVAKYKHNEDVLIIRPPEKLTTDDELMAYEPEHVSLDEWEKTIVDKSVLQGATFDKLYFDGPVAPENLRVDKGFNQKLMPVWMIKDKHKRRLQRKIDAIMEDPNSDVSQVIRLKYELEKLDQLPTVKIYEKALKNIEEDGLDKPEIKRKLRDAIDRHKVGG